MVPQKRQKVEHHVEDGGQKAQFTAGGKGGVLGQYVKEQQDEGRKKNQASSAFVDLSGQSLLGLFGYW